MKIELASDAPLAERLRPKSVEEFIGQKHLRGRLSTMAAGGRLPSMLLFGPPGCGKSTIAILLAKATGLPFRRLSAPETGLAALRKEIQGFRVLILDELHRYSKAQQDFFLPILESGELTLLATTTENPSFSVTRQLLSRLHVLKLRALEQDELLEVAKRGAAALNLDLSEESLELLASMSGGDARTLLNLIEYAAKLPPEKLVPAELAKTLPEMVIRGDRGGDSHYELASAMIKSIRGSDPDAALYYLACMLESGEDPRFVCRRLILSASEDIGLADPYALPLAVSTQQAVEMVGMPEGFIPLAECTVYLALAPKSNSTYAAYLAVQQEVRRDGPRPVPLHLRNAATKLQKDWGFGRGYKYPHAFPEGWADQEYLPQDISGRRFYHPREHGMEPKINLWYQKVLKMKAGRGKPPSPPDKGRSS
ncbi:MgsA AAA+ ATPase domain-containing protein [Alkalidesulfovibrio alkalitolerans DSM 16529]|uniref:Replication-associated recombination protein A n=1 Tax=Alkalidesulfovibrio alkalitolerans DSM 16529 TaxID=1121439 RepID=S7U910_9BACT|nr:replication-associated recombination protein A [Alkalidesulfovibrio alkalitolerans]EPR30429.1 MgsA AAA+ ATPase domain-containing protein [Alkalidesulfovibrio alkalitolerans DSM 16529]